MAYLGGSHTPVCIRTTETGFRDGGSGRGCLHFQKFPGDAAPRLWTKFREALTSLIYFWQMPRRVLCYTQGNRLRDRVTWPHSSPPLQYRGWIPTQAIALWFWTSLVAQMVKASAYNEGDPGSIPGPGSPGEGNGNPLQTLAWKIPWMDGGAS